jgi:hypothetical protein
MAYPAKSAVEAQPLAEEHLGSPHRPVYHNHEDARLDLGETDVEAIVDALRATAAQSRNQEGREARTGHGHGRGGQRKQRSEREQASMPSTAGAGTAGAREEKRKQSAPTSDQLLPNLLCMAPMRSRPTTLTKTRMRRIWIVTTRRAESVFATMSPNPTVENTATVKYSQLT